jgi:hypothetical protein
MDANEGKKRTAIASVLVALLLLPLASVGANPTGTTDASDAARLRSELSAALVRIDKLESDVRVLEGSIKVLAAKLPPASSPPASAPAVKPAPAEQEQAEQTVYVTRSGAKYHRAGCSYLKSGGSPMPLSQTKGKYSPCSRRNPPS